MNCSKPTPYSDVSPKVSPYNKSNRRKLPSGTKSNPEQECCWAGRAEQSVPVKRRSLQILSKPWPLMLEVQQWLA